MAKIESLINKSIDEIDSDIISTFESINVRVAVLEYKYKNCGRRYPAEDLKLATIDYYNIISFDELFKFRKIFIIWHLNGTITDLEFFNISSEIEILKNDYYMIADKIRNGEAHKLRAGDTKFLKATMLSTLVPQPYSNKKANLRQFALSKYYLGEMLNEISAVLIE